MTPRLPFLPPKADPPFKRKPERRRVTLIAGFLTRDAIVMAADSEEVISDYAKTSTQKIGIINFYGNWLMAIGGAGDAPYIDLFQETLHKRLSLFQKFEFSKIESVIRATLHEIHKKHIWPRHGDQKAAFQAIIAIQGLGESKGRSLLYTCDSALLKINGLKGFMTIGIGGFLANYVIRRSMSPFGGISNMPTEQVRNLAVHVLAEVKSRENGIQNVGGETNVLVIHTNGAMRWMIESEVAEVESWMDAYHRSQRSVFLAVASPRVSDS